MTASSHIIHSPNWHRGWNPTSSGIWSAWSFPQLLLKSLFFFSNVKQKFPFLLFPITLLIVIFLFNGHLGRNVDIEKDNYPVHGNNCQDRSSNNLHKNRGNGVAHKGRTWPREMSFILKSHKNVFSSDTDIPLERCFAQSSAQWGFCCCHWHQQSCCLCRENWSV